MVTLRLSQISQVFLSALLSHSFSIFGFQPLQLPSIPSLDNRNILTDGLEKCWTPVVALVKHNLVRIEGGLLLADVDIV